LGDKSRSRRLLGGLIALSLVLISCGTLQVNIEFPPSPTSAPSTQAIIDTPVAQATQGPVAVTKAAATATGVVSGRRLKAGQKLVINEIHMFSPDEGWGVGRAAYDPNNTVLRTSDGGLTWQDVAPLQVFASTPADGLAAVTFFGSKEHAWAAFAPRTPQPPDQPVVWTTSDGGMSWTPGQPLDFSNVQVEYYLPGSLGFSDELNGWLLVHLGAGMSHDYIAIFTTADGGKTWKRVLDPGKNGDMMSCNKTGIGFSAPADGWLVGDCPGLMPDLFLYHSKDGGQTWSKVSLPAPLGEPENFIQDSNNGCGIQSLVYSLAQTIILDMRCMRYSVGTAWSWLYVSMDGGQSWKPYSLPANYGILNFADADDGWLLAMTKEDNTAGGEIFHTSDGGKTWLEVLGVGWQGTPEFPDANNGWVVAHSGDLLALVHTSDGGKTWEELKPVIGQ
jgi:photosystem II stability/assembly factor-like uncharacterized protein